jgi:hypothetical protein
LGGTPTQAQAAAPTGAWPDLQKASERQGGGDKDAAVIVGIEDYAFAPDVPGAQANAEAWYRHLTGVRGVPATKVRLLRNEDATLEEMRDSVAQAAREVRPGGTLWFVFIGHGAPASTGDDGLLIGVDAQQTATGLAARSLRRSELLAALEGGAGEPVVVLDACFSGQSTHGEAIAKGLQPLRLAELAAPKSAVVLTAARSNQYAGALPGTEVPAFSYLVLGAVRGWADDDDDGQVTAGEAVRYSGAVMRTTIKGRSQTPDLGGPNGKVLGRATEAGPDLAALVLASGSAAPSQPADTGRSDVQPDLARAGQGAECVDNRGCAEGTSCQAGSCRIDHVYIGSMERAAKSMVVGGAIVVGVGAAMTPALWVSLAAIPNGGLDIDESSAPAVWAVGTIGVLGVVAGGITLALGTKKRRHATALRGAVDGIMPSLQVGPRAATVGLRGRF